MDKHSLLLSQTDFSDFKDFPINKSNKRSDSSSSTHSSFDDDYRDVVYAEHYFKGATSSPSSKTTSDNDLVIISSDNDLVELDTPQATPINQDRASKVSKRKSKGKDSIKKKKKKKNTNKSKENTDAMEFDSDCEIIDYPHQRGTITSDRQASIQARLPDSMAANDKWFLVQKDLLGRERYEQLYEFKRYNLQQMRCINCKQRGHSKADCPQAKRHTICYLCGTINHVSSRCPDSVCQYCFQPSHRGKPCKPSLSNPRQHCNRCYMRGHAEHLCPEGWRQFHNTTHNSNRLYQLNKSRTDHQSYCCMCSNDGHYGFECTTQQRPRGYPAPFTPLIAHYDHNAFNAMKITKNDNPRSSRKRKNNQSDYERKQPRHDHHYESQPSLESRHNHHYHPQSSQERRSSNSSNQSNYSLIPEPRRSSVTIPIWRTTPPDHYGHVTTSTPNYRPSIHERLDPLPLLDDYNQPSSSHRVRSLSFEHSRIPEALFNTPSSPPRWNVEGPSSFPRRPHHHNQATPTRNQPILETPYGSFPPRPPTPPRPRNWSRYNTDMDNNRITDWNKTYTKFNKKGRWSFDIELPHRR